MHAQTLNDVIEPYRHLPTVIQTALLRVETHPTFRTITGGMLKVLKALVTRASATNGTAAIRARLDRVSLEADVSTKTVQRAMRAFNEFGWIEPVSENRSEHGVFCSRRYAFSPSFCALVHLPTRDKPAAALAQETEMSDGAIYVDLSYKEDLREIAVEQRGQTPIVLHPDVQVMHAETKILDTGICMLLGMAKKINQKLADVYEVAKPYLVAADITGGRALRYIAAMLDKPIDYAAKAAQARRMTESASSANATKTTAARCRFKRFIANNGAVVRFFDGTAEVTRDGHSAMLAGQQMLVLYADVDTGKLREIIE